MNKRAAEQPVKSVERHPLVTILSLTISAVLILSTWRLFRDMNPWGFLLMVPAAFSALHALWTLLNPFAEVYADRVELRRMVLGSRSYFFNDIKKVGQSDGKTFIVYKDDEMERVSLFGIRPSERDGFFRMLSENITLG